MQQDRFLLKIIVPYPDRGGRAQPWRSRVHQGNPPDRLDERRDLPRCWTSDSSGPCRGVCRAVRMEPAVVDYVVNHGAGDAGVRIGAGRGESARVDFFAHRIQRRGHCFTAVIMSRPTMWWRC